MRRGGGGWEGRDDSLECEAWLGWKFLAGELKLESIV